MSGNNGSGSPFDFLKGSAGDAEKQITVNAFLLNIAVGLCIFALELTGFLLLKGSVIGRRLYQPKTYLVQERLRVEVIPQNPLKWIRRIFSLKSEELKAKCGLDGYFFIRFIRAMIVIFLPLMTLLIVILLPVNIHGGKNTANTAGFNRLSWSNVARSQTDRYWAHLVCALLVIVWTIYRIWKEKLHFIETRQKYFTSPEHRLKASARTILVTNIPSEYCSAEALKALYDIFVDNDERSRLVVWVNRNYAPLRKLVNRRRNLCSALEKEELRILRLVNKKRPQPETSAASERNESIELPPASEPAAITPDAQPTKYAYAAISDAFEAERLDDERPWRAYLENFSPPQITVEDDGAGHLRSVGLLNKLFGRGEKTNRKQVPKIPWMRAEIARLTVQIDGMLANLDDREQYPRQNSAFIQFDRQMAAHMACSLVSHHLFGRMNPRFLDVAPHEILWPNMGLTSLSRSYRGLASLVLFAAMLVLWGIPTTFLGIISQLESLRASTSWLKWLRSWPTWIISLIAGPVASLLLALLVQLVVPGLCRKLAVLFGAPTRGTRETITQQFYFVFLLVELVLVTSISSGLIATVPELIQNPTQIAQILAQNLPKGANYFFNYLIIQAFGFSGSVLFQYLRILYITLIWPCFTQTPRQEAWLQTTIPHQMWGNVYPLFTNFAVIGLIYSVTNPLILVFSSATFVLFWIAYRHNYYYVQRNKVDTHGLLFNNALSQLFAGIYLLEITLIGLFFLVRNEQGDVACSAQAIITIVATVLTAAAQYSMDQVLKPLTILLPVTLDDQAVETEREWMLARDKVDQSGSTTSGSTEPGTDHPHGSEGKVEQVNPLGAASKEKTGAQGGEMDKGLSARQKDLATTADNARQQLSRLRKDAAARLAINRVGVSLPSGISQMRQAEDQLGAAIAGFPDELADLSPSERDAELRAAYQDPVTREPAPIIWIPQDRAGLSDKVVQSSRKWGRFLQYSNAGARLTERNKCVITEPSPDIRGDWLLDWAL